jgi:hypothetical protein
MANHLSFDELSRVVEHRLSAAEEARARRHLSHCGRCRSEVEWLARIWTLPGRPIGPDASRGSARSGRVLKDLDEPSSDDTRGYVAETPGRVDEAEPACN